MKSIIAQEVAGLPRGVARNVMKRVESSESRLMTSIPELLKKHFDQCKQPSLKSSIAGKSETFYVLING